jgi:hypothetical protein
MKNLRVGGFSPTGPVWVNIDDLVSYLISFNANNSITMEERELMNLLIKQINSLKE